MQDRIAFAMVGDVNDPGIASGTPYFALTYAARLGLDVRGLRLCAEGPAWKRRRILWNARQLLSTGTRGGYQYSEAFLTRLWQADPPTADEDLINMFQIYPSSIFRTHEGRLFFYVDQTLQQMFDTYGLSLPDAVMCDAMARERNQYHQAEMVLTQSAYAARSVIEEYCVPPEKVRAVIGGANLEPDVLDAWESTARPERAPGALRLVFVGKDWQRKGLDRLIAGMVRARAQGAALELRVLGVRKQDVPEALARVEGIDWAGFIDKRHEAQRFVELVSSCDVGCLLSRAEAGGMSLREFCRLGLVTLAPAVGGSPEYVLPEASHLVGAEDDADRIAAILHRLATDEVLLARQRATAWAARRQASWEQPIAEIAGILARG